jgi:hypothetical protein
MIKKVWNDTRAAFADGADGREYANDYLSAVRNNWSTNENGITRSSFLIVGLGALFELLLATQVNKFTVTYFGASFSGAGAIIFAAPVIVSYLYYHMTYAWIESGIFRSAHDSVIRALYPTIDQRNAERPLHPSNSILSSVERVRISLGKETLPSKFARFTGLIRPMVIAVSPPLFAILAYFQLFNKYHAANLWVWAGLAVSLILLACGFINISIVIDVDYRTKREELSIEKAVSEAGKP